MSWNCIILTAFLSPLSFCFKSVKPKGSHLLFKQPLGSLFPWEAIALLVIWAYYNYNVDQKKKCSACIRMEKIEHYANIDSRMRKHSRSLGKDGLITNWGQLDMQIK